MVEWFAGFDVNFKYWVCEYMLMCVFVYARMCGYVYVCVCVLF